jgi:hypothetical protein
MKNHNESKYEEMYVEMRIEVWRFKKGGRVWEVGARGKGFLCRRPWKSMDVVIQ